ncbi:hypothetical protein E2C01_096001 [Portunus trituberculatus]|uniref:Uncharacterized protein n=1 Tax=Portunus trituberculatus TaxID=210409 RepID=A0A5B7K0V7_PORTR|nr:hypothetical protein [Portunus trituberculatus]
MYRMYVCVQRSLCVYDAATGGKDDPRVADAGAYRPPDDPELWALRGGRGACGGEEALMSTGMEEEKEKKEEGTERRGRRRLLPPAPP